MRAEDLIEKLSHEAVPQPMASPRVWMTWLIILWAVYEGLLVTFLGFRTDWVAQMHNPAYFGELLGLAAMSLTSLIAVQHGMYPDNYQRPWVAKAPLFAAIIFCAAIVWQTLIAPLDWSTAWNDNLIAGCQCTVGVFLMSVIPTIFLFFVLRRGAGTEPGRSGFWIILASASIACFASRVAEHDGIEHFILWHYLPLLVFALIGYLLGPRLLRW